MKTKTLLFLFALLIASYSAAFASSPQQAPARRLPTGAIVNIAPTWSAGADNILIVNNGQDLDAVVELVRNGVPMISVYVRAHDSYTIGPVWHDTYSVNFVLGQDWDGNAMTFTTQVRRDRFDQPLVFERKILNYYTGSPTIEFTYWKAYLGSANPGDAKTLEQLGGSRPFLLFPFDEDS